MEDSREHVGVEHLCVRHRDATLAALQKTDAIVIIDGLITHPKQNANALATGNSGQSEHADVRIAQVVPRAAPL